MTGADLLAFDNGAWLTGVLKSAVMLFGIVTMVVSRGLPRIGVVARGFAGTTIVLDGRRRRCLST